MFPTKEQSRRPKIETYAGKTKNFKIQGRPHVILSNN